jgi:hypothetical protein
VTSYCGELPITSGGEALASATPLTRRFHFDALLPRAIIDGSADLLVPSMLSEVRAAELAPEPTASGWRRTLKGELRRGNALPDLFVVAISGVLSSVVSADLE